MLTPIPKNRYNGFIYMWINCVNNKKYIGSHWGHEDDGYIGSGVIFKKAIKKYGISNFTRVIIEFKNYKNEKELREAEIFYLTSLKVMSKDIYYNLTESAGCSKRSLESRVKQSNTMKGKKQTKECIDKRTKSLKQNYKGVFITPNGIFTSAKEASKICNISYKTIIKYCKENRPNWSYKNRSDYESGK